MSRPKTTRYLICYDIHSDERRGRVATLLEDHGTRVQYSVFECDLDQRTLLKVRRGLLRHMDQSTDNVRIYILCHRCEVAVDYFGTGPILSDENVIIV